MALKDWKRIGLNIKKEPFAELSNNRKQWINIKNGKILTVTYAGSREKSMNRRSVFFSKYDYSWLGLRSIVFVSKTKNVLDDLDLLEKNRIKEYRGLDAIRKAKMFAIQYMRRH